ncbi:hypothetical protein Lsha_0198 [Legionella shakespearei DSM 23087]|uniref:Uncharacterized protein n=1 Tax=Legionella shakespearei DSM 23087 TaxID=1122169 RepID=A0A0W0Z9N5_9GAMM|nr:hypothetical protein Lsha_0198 [Legionella shakespearei DSM 23087]
MRKRNSDTGRDSISAEPLAPADKLRDVGVNPGWCSQRCVALSACSRETDDRYTARVLKSLHSRLQADRATAPGSFPDPRRPERVFLREGSPEGGTVLIFGEPSRKKTRSG